MPIQGVTKFSKKTPPRLRKDSERERKGWFSDRVKLKAVKMWLACGNLVEVSSRLNIPYPTVKTWRYQTDWWDVYVRELTSENNQKKDAKLETLLETSYNILDDRLKNGDIILDSRTGELINVPMKGKDVATVARSLHQQQQDIREAPAQAAARQATNEMLVDLAKQFAQIAKGGKGNKEKVIDGEAFEVMEEVKQIEEQYNGK